MRWVVVTGLVLLCACTSSVEKNEKQYEMVKNSKPDAGELCAKGRTVIDEYLKAGDEQKYRLRKGEIETDCVLASMNQKYGMGRFAQAELDNSDSVVTSDHVVKKPKPVAEPTYDNPDDPSPGAPYDNTVQ